MIVYGSAIESAVPALAIDELKRQGKLHHLLISYYYLRKSGFKWLNDIEDLIIDSGAHSFQKGARAALIFIRGGALCSERRLLSKRKRF